MLNRIKEKLALCNAALTVGEEEAKKKNHDTSEVSFYACFAERALKEVGSRSHRSKQERELRLRLAGLKAAASTPNRLPLR